MNSSKIVSISAVAITIGLGGYLLSFKATDSIEPPSTAEKPARAPSIKASDAELKDLSTFQIHGSSCGPDCQHDHASNNDHNRKSIINTPKEKGATKPLNHDVLPKIFAKALRKDDETGEFLIPLHADAFTPLETAQIGDVLTLELNDDISLQATVMGLQVYPPETPLFKITLQLENPEGHFYFFESEKGLLARMVFNEKSIALVHNDNSEAPGFRQTEISQLYCAEEGSVFPLNHPSNVNSFFQAGH